MFNRALTLWSKKRASSLRACGPLSRRLAVETLEKRLVLSAPEIDQDTWNIDPPDPYAVIAQDYVGSDAGDAFVHVTINPQGHSNLFDLYIAEKVQWQVGDGHAQLDAGLVGTGRAVTESPITPHRPSATDTAFAYESGGLQGVLLNSDLTLLFDPSGNRLLTMAEMATSGRLVVIEVGRPEVRVDWNGVGNSSNGAEFSLFGDRSTSAYVWSGEVSLDAINAIGEWATFWHDDASSSLLSDDSTTAKAESEGGAIPLESIVAHVGGESMPLVNGGPQVVDWTPKQPGEAEVAAMPASFTISGELARAVAFEVIDGEAAPVVYAATEGSGAYAMMSRPLNTADGAKPLQLAPPANSLAQRASAAWSDADYRASASREDSRRVHPAAFEWALATMPIAELASEAHIEAFSQLGELQEESELVEGEPRSRLWLAAMPVLAVLTAERLVAAKKKADREKAERLAV